VHGARQIIGFDIFESKREMATRAGATDFVNSAEKDPAKAVRALTGEFGVDHAFEAVDNAASTSGCSASSVLCTEMALVSRDTPPPACASRRHKRPTRSHESVCGDNSCLLR
jgi:Zn-dependent alcohol dehydrogenase